MRPPLLCIVGPTASGKNDLALALAESVGGEIISADSVQVYRYFDIGTGKPSAEERSRAPHHLIDVLEPEELLDAAGFAERAATIIEEVLVRGKVPIVCGGSFLWLRALLFGLASAPPGDPKIRERHREWAERQGRAALHQKLREVDPESADRLNANDFVRVSRALEVHEISGVPLSEHQRAHGFRESRYAHQLVGISRHGAELDARIRARTERMFRAGWLDETRDLCQRHRHTRAMGSIGYKQVARALEEADVDIASLTEEVVRATRIFARRQRTWLRDEPVRWLSAAELEGSVQELEKAVGLERA